MPKHTEPLDVPSDNYLLYGILLVIILVFIIFGYFIKKLLNNVHDINVNFEKLNKLTTDESKENDSITEIIRDKLKDSEESKDAEKVEEQTDKEDIKLDRIDEQTELASYTFEDN